VNAFPPRRGRDFERSSVPPVSPPANLQRPSGVSVAPFDFASTFSAIFFGRGSVLMKCDGFGGERKGSPAHLKMVFK